MKYGREIKAINKTDISNIFLFATKFIISEIVGMRRFNKVANIISKYYVTNDTSIMLKFVRSIYFVQPCFSTLRSLPAF